MVASLSLAGCATGKIPVWHGKLWAGDSASRAIRRAQASERIGCDDPRFDEYRAMHRDALREFHTLYILGCKEWKQGVAPFTAEEIEEAYKNLQELRR